MKKIFIVLIVVLICVLGWVLISPLFITVETNESLPEDFVVKEQTVDKKTENSVITTESTVSAVDSAQPTVVKSGVFTDADSFHQGEGTATIITNQDSSILRFDEFEVTNGPDLYVLLSKNSNPEDKGSLGEYIELGRLKGNKGSQNYDLSGVDLDAYASAVIYCKAFGVVFSTATLQ